GQNETHGHKGNSNANNRGHGHNGNGHGNNGNGHANNGNGHANNGNGHGNKGNGHNTGQPHDNRGTVKIHEGAGEPAPLMRNQPQVCAFHIHAFKFYPGETLTFSIVGQGGP